MGWLREATPSLCSPPRAAGGSSAPLEAPSEAIKAWRRGKLHFRSLQSAQSLLDDSLPVQFKWIPAFAVSGLAFRVLVVLGSELPWSEGCVGAESSSLPIGPSPLSSTHPPLERGPGAGFYQIPCAGGHGLSHTSHCLTPSSSPERV